MTSQPEGASTSRLRDALAAIGVVPTVSKLRRPAVGIVSRAGLVASILDRRPAIVTVIAPAGYGKSTFAAELVANDCRPAAWVTLSDEDDDPAVLLSDVAFAIDAIAPVDPAVVRRLWAGTPPVGAPAVQLFGAMFAAHRPPFVLVLDDVHRLASRDAVRALSTLVAELPRTSTIVLSSRVALPLPLGRTRAQRRLVEIGPSDLAFAEHEAARLFGALGVAVAAPELNRLVERTEGWPVALSLAALACEAHGPGVVDEVTGDHRYLVDYLGDEVLGAVDADVASFLMDASCLDRVSGELCDEVLQRQGSAPLLEELHRRQPLVIALDGRRQWYRFHRLLGEFLQTELQRRDPARHAAIHRRASAWCDERGDPHGAVAHATRSGDIDLTEAMVLRWWDSVATAGGGRPSTDRWDLLFPRHELERRPLLMVDAAWGRFAAGDAGAALGWLERAAAALPEPYPHDAHGLVAPIALAAARSIIAPLPPAQMAADAAYVHDRVALGEGHPLSCLALGAAAFMVGDDMAAARWLREGADTTLPRPLVVANCLAHLALVDLRHDRWSEAAPLARRARTLVGGAATFASTALVLAVNVLVDTRAGRAGGAEADRRLCRQHLDDLLGMAPWLTLQAHLALGRAASLRGNRDEAADLVDRAAAILAGVDGAVGVTAQLSALSRDVAERDASPAVGPAALTVAELRVLQLLTTHLTIPEIADRLYVSRNTVKSQTIAIYRKLGTSSRSGAVQAASVAGLLEPAARAS